MLTGIFELKADSFSLKIKKEKMIKSDVSVKTGGKKEEIDSYVLEIT